jgi:hypothetical protein
VSSPVKRGLAFYQGQKVTFIAGSPGGGTDGTARGLAPLLSTYLHASVSVEDFASAQSISSSDALAAAAPTGLTIGYVNAPAIASTIFTHTPGYNFNPGRLSYIAGQLASVAVLVATPSSAYTSFGSLKQSPTPVKILATATGQSVSGLEILLGILGVPYHYVTGYSNESALVTGFQRGDAALAILTYANAYALIAAGQARPIAITLLPPKGAVGRAGVINTPTYPEILNQYLPKHASKTVKADAQVLETFNAMGQPIVTQGTVAGYKLNALRVAVAWAFKQTSFKAAALGVGSSPQYINPVQAKAAYNSMIEHGTGVTCYLEGTC